MKVCIGKVIMLLVLSPIIFISQSCGFDLTEAYEKALQYNADYLAQIAATNAGLELQNQAKAALLPSVSANGTYSEAYLSSAGMSVYYSQPTLGAQIQQTVFDFGKFSTYTKSKFAAEVAELQLTNARQKLMVNVSQAYFDVLYAVDNLDAIRINKEAFLTQMEQAKKSFDAGTATIADVNDAKANYDMSVAQELQAENNLMNRKTIFQNMTGLNPDLIQPLVDDLILNLPSPQSPESWSDMAKAGNLDVKVARSQLDMATQDIKIAKSGHLPVVNFVGNYQMQGTANINGTDSAQTQAYISQLANIPGIPISSYNNSMIGLQVSVPIFSGGGINSQVRQAIANYEVAQQQLTKVMRSSDQSILNAFYQVQNGVSAVKAQTQALKSAKIKLSSDKTGYKVGIRNSVDLINAQNDYVKALLNYNQSRYQYLTYEVQLEYLAGRINEDFIQAIDNNIRK